MEGRAKRRTAGQCPPVGSGNLPAEYRRRPARALVGFSTPVFTPRFDPTNEKFAAAEDKPVSNQGGRHFTPPGKNSVGDNDLVLILTAGAKQQNNEAQGNFALLLPARRVIRRVQPPTGPAYRLERFRFVWTAGPWPL